MFEREIKFIYDFNLNRINKIGSYLTFEQLLSLEIHPAILKYISAEIDFLIFEDRQKLLQDSVFDYSGEKISSYFNLIDDEIKKSKKLSIEYIDKLLLHAISFIVNYLVHPRWTLSRFLFDKDESKSAAEIKQIIKYVYSYNYLTDTLISYIDKKKLVSAEQTEVESIIKKIDDFAIESYLPNIIGTAVNSMSEFFSIGTVQHGKIPINAVKLFLEEKNLDVHIKKLEATFPQGEKIRYTTSDVLNALSSGELIFNLKEMQTEQIDENELDKQEFFEFESVEEKESGSENSNETNNEIQNFESEYPQEKNIIPDQIEAESEEEMEGLSIHEATNYENDHIPDNDLIAEKHDNESEDIEEIGSSDESVQEVLHESIDDSTLSTTAINEDKFEFEKVLEKDENPIIDFVDNSSDSSEKIPDRNSNKEITNDSEENSIDCEQENNFEEANKAVEENNTESFEVEELGNEDLQSEKLVLEEIRTEEKENTNTSEEKESAADSLAYEFQNDGNNIHENISKIVEETESDAQNGNEVIQENEFDVEKDEKAVANSFGFGDIEQPELFPKEEIESHETEEVDSKIIDKTAAQEKEPVIGETDSSTKIELSELLENKNMNKILKVIFDYDMDDFVNSIENISECKNEDEAEKILKSIYHANGVKPTSKEAKFFSSIITEYFKKK